MCLGGGGGHGGMIPLVVICNIFVTFAYGLPIVSPLDSEYYDCAGKLRQETMGDEK